MRPCIEEESALTANTANGVDAGTARSEADGDPALAARICWYYFKEGQTQDAIAQRLQITRKRVNRILGDARESGLVRITIGGAIGPCAALEGRLISSYGLQQAIVVPSPLPGSDVRQMVGAAAGQYVSDRLPPSGSLGITWGGTVNAAAHSVARRSGEATSVVLLCGGLAESGSINPYDNAAMMARALGAKCYYLTAPLFAETAALRDALVGSEPVRTVLARVSTLDLALLSAIDLSEQSRALEYGVISQEDWRSLRQAGAVGDICGHYLNAVGKLVPHPLTQRAVNPPLADILRIKDRILAAGGVQKVPIIRAALLAGLCHVLITDEDAAERLLETPKLRS